MASEAPKRVVISGAAGQIAYSLIPLLASGSVFGENTHLSLVLFDIPPMKVKLEAVAMEIDDCGFPLVKEVLCTTELKEAFVGADIVVLLGGIPRTQGMERKDLLSKNSPIFVGQGKAINDYANKSVKVLVVANPANTNCWVTATNAPDLPKSSFSALTRLDHNRALKQLAIKAQTDTDQVKNVIIWGNHSSTMVPDLSHATVTLHDDDGGALEVKALTHVNDAKWVEHDFLPLVQTRGASIIAKRGSSSAFSAAVAIADHLRDWTGSTKPGEHVSMGIWSSGQYGVASDLIFSFPVTVTNGTVQVVPDLVWDARTAELIKKTEHELLDERAEAQAILHSS